jgi:hypothetical protein
VNLGVWRAGAVMVALTDDATVLYNHRADHRVRRGQTYRAPGQSQGALHHLGIEFN